MCEPEKVSRVVSHALRHAPSDYGLQLDAEGWVSLAALVAALRAHGFPDLAEADVTSMVEQAGKKRHEIREGRIRASYGHSVAVHDTLVAQEPPAVLFHGTTPEAALVIAREGLKPVSRRHVHLSPDLEVARAVAARRTGTPVILTVRAAEASAAGTRFEQREAIVWVAESIPAEFIDPA